jgi:large subunit ribosomal protein L35
MACPTILSAPFGASIHQGSKMPKMKSKSGAKKRFSLTATGKVKFKGAYSAHRLVSKRKSAKARNKGTSVLVAADAYKVKRYWLA